MQNKKGEISIGVVVAIIISVAVLVFLIIGFRTQWNMFQGRTEVYVGNANVDDMKNSCYMSCMNDAQYDYCTVKKTLKLESGDTGVFTCEQMEKGIYKDTLNKKDKPHAGKTQCEEGPIAINKKAKEDAEAAGSTAPTPILFECEEVVPAFEECSRITCPASTPA